MTLEEKLRECEHLRNALGFQGITKERVSELMLQSLRLENALRLAISQRDEWIERACTATVNVVCNKNTDDAELLALLNGGGE